MYQPTNAQLLQKSDSQYIASFDVDVLEHEHVTEIANFLVGNVRVIVFDVTGPDEPDAPTQNLHVDSAPYTRESEDEVEIAVAKGGKLKGTTRASYA